MFLWNVGHSHVWANITNPKVADVAQAYALATVLTSQLANQAVIGPMTSKYAQRDPHFTIENLMNIHRTMFQRHRLEKEEKKAYNEPGVGRTLGQVKM